MHDEAHEVLRRELEAIGFQRGLWSATATARRSPTIYAGTARDPHMRGLALMVPLFFIEDMSMRLDCRAPSVAYDTPIYVSGSRSGTRMSTTVHNWCARGCADFREWDLTEALAYIRVPILIVQGEHDQYGTMRQIETAREEMLLPGRSGAAAGNPARAYREAPEATLNAIADFANRLLRDHHEGDLPANATE